MDWVFIQRRATGLYMHDLGVGFGLAAIVEPYTRGDRRDGAVFLTRSSARASGFERRTAAS